MIYAKNKTNRTELNITTEETSKGIELGGRVTESSVSKFNQELVNLWGAGGRMVHWTQYRQ